MGALRRGAAILCWGVAMLWAWPNKGRGQKVGVAFKAVAYGLGREREYGRG